MGLTSAQHRELTFPPGDPCAYDEGIAFTRQTFADWHLTDAAEDCGAVLVAAELLANAIRHADGPRSLSLEHDGDHLRIAVSDTHPGPLRMRRPRPDRIGGHGIRIIDRLTHHHWGTGTAATGKTVWARLALPPTGPGPGRTAAP